MPADEPELPEPYIVSVNGFDGMEVMFNVGRGVQTLVANDEGRIVAAVVPVGAWYPGARVPAGIPVQRPGQWLEEGADERARRRAIRRAGPDREPAHGVQRGPAAGADGP